MNIDALAGPRAKVERAKRHVEELKCAVQAFLDTGPYEVRADMDSNGRVKGPYRLTRVEVAPIHFAGIAGDVLSNLRSALDHIAYRAVTVGLTQPPAKPWEIEYPIADSANEYPALRDKKVKGARQDALDAIDASRPYRGGEDALWRIKKLNNIDKHRFLLTVGSAFRAVNFKSVIETHRRGMRYTGSDGLERMTGRETTVPDIWIKPADRMFPLEVGKELPSFNIDPDKKMEYIFDIAFGEPHIVEGEPLIKTLQYMVDVVDNLLPGFIPSLT
jgi:hypothetical protein